MIQDKKILITGGAGSIGQELVRQLVPCNDVTFIDKNENALMDLVEELKQKKFKISGTLGDIRDRRVFGEDKFDLIFHAAAYKHVAISAFNPKEYLSTNCLGTWNIIEFAKKVGAKLINISTDKVVNANSVMGATKKVAEIMVRDAGGVSVRFGNVMGSDGSVIPFWQRQLDRGEPLNVTDERMMRYFMTIPEACKLVIKAAEIGEPGQTMIMEMGEKKSVYELALEILKKSGKESLGTKLIGIRPGETLEEKLMTPDEEAKATKVENFWII